MLNLWNFFFDVWKPFYCLSCPCDQELSQDSFSSQSSAPPSNQPMASNKSSQEDSMQARPSSLPVSPLSSPSTCDLCLLYLSFISWFPWAPTASILWSVNVYFRTFKQWQKSHIYTEIPEYLTSPVVRVLLFSYGQKFCCC